MPNQSQTTIHFRFLIPSQIQNHVNTVYTAKHDLGPRSSISWSIPRTNSADPHKTYILASLQSRQHLPSISLCPQLPLFPTEDPWVYLAHLHHPSYRSLATKSKNLPPELPTTGHPSLNYCHGRPSVCHMLSSFIKSLVSSP
jgi:hypothetical protein